MLLSSGPQAEGGDFDADIDIDDGPDVVTPDGSGVFFATEERLTDADMDSDRDLYVRENGELRLISDRGDDEPFLAAISADGTRVVYTDDNDDIFVNDGGASARLVFITGAPWRLSADGTRLIIESLDPLLAEDLDGESDLYRMTLALPPRNTTPPAITGTAAVGGALSCSTGTWSGDAAQYAYTWNRNGMLIAGATAATYTVAPPDGGKQLTCTVTATDEIGSASATSAAVTVPAVAGPPPPPPAARRPRARREAQTGTAADDDLTGAGDDVLRGLGTADCLSGGAGNDRLSGGGGADRAGGGKGDDALSGGRGATG